MEPLPRFLRSPYFTALKFAVSLGLLALLVHQVEIEALWSAARNAGGLPFLIAIGLAAAAYPLCALRWWALLRITQSPLPFRRAHAVVWIGQFYNAFLPGGIGGDAARLAYAFRDHPGNRAAAATATAVDRFVGFFVLLVMAAVGLGSYALTHHLPSNGKFILTSMGFAASLVGLGFMLLPGLAARLPEAWARPLLKVRGDVRGTVLASLLSAGVWILDFLSGWVLARAVGLPFGPVEIGTALALAYTSALLPISLGGHGVREGALVLALIWIAPGASHSADQLSAFALLFLGTSLACSLAGGVVLLAVRKR